MTGIITIHLPILMYQN